MSKVLERAQEKYGINLGNGKKRYKQGYEHYLAGATEQYMIDKITFVSRARNAFCESCGKSGCTQPCSWAFRFDNIITNE